MPLGAAIAAVGEQRRRSSAGEAHVARSRPCERRVAPRAPEEDGTHCKAAKRKPLRHCLAASLFIFAREAQAAKCSREAASPGRPSKAKEFKTVCSTFSAEMKEDFAAARR